MFENHDEQALPSNDPDQRPQRKKWPRSILRYVRELSIVVAGIFITFTVNDAVSDRKEKLEAHRYLGAVRVELEDNLEILIESELKYRKVVRLSKYLSSTTPDKLNADTLSQYAIGDAQLFVHSSSAYQMFQSSGVMSMITDKELLTSIMDSYKLLEAYQNYVENYIQRKTDIMVDTQIENPSGDFWNISDPKNRKLYAFLSIHYDLDMAAREVRERVEYALSMFN